MLRRTLGIGLLAALLATLAEPLAAQKDNKKPDPKDVPSVDSDKLQPGDLTGKLRTLPTTAGDFTLRSETQQIDPKSVKPVKSNNPALQQYYRDQQHLLDLQARLQSARTQQEQLRLLQQIQQAATQMQLHQNDQAIRAALAAEKAAENLKYITTYQDVDLHMGPDVKVRFAEPPQAFDEKGNVKVYTKEELEQLKGKDKKLPGYEGSLDKLQVGMKVKVTLVRAPKKDPPKDAPKDAPAKDAPAKEAAAKDAPKPDEKKADADMPPDHKILVSMIYVIDATTGTDGTTDKPKKNK
jgi:hypothetical protein